MSLEPTPAGSSSGRLPSSTQEPETMNQIIARLIGQKAAAKLPEQLRDIIGLSAEDMQNRGLTEKQSSRMGFCWRDAPSRNGTCRTERVRRDCVCG